MSQLIIINTLLLKSQGWMFSSACMFHVQSAAFFASFMTFDIYFFYTKIYSFFIFFFSIISSICLYKRFLLLSMWYKRGEIFEEDLKGNFILSGDFISLNKINMELLILNLLSHSKLLCFFRFWGELSAILFYYIFFASLNQGFI